MKFWNLPLCILFAVVIETGVAKESDHELIHEKFYSNLLSMVISDIAMQRNLALTACKISAIRRYADMILSYELICSLNRQFLQVVDDDFYGIESNQDADLRQV